MLILQIRDLLILEIFLPFQMGLVYTPVFPFLSVLRFIHLNGNDLKIIIFTLSVPRHRIFHPHDVVPFLLQMGGDSHGEQRALIERVLYRLIKALSRHKKFIIPYGNIPELFVLMDQPHQPLRVLPVLFPVAQEHVCVESVPNLFSQLVSDQHGIKECLKHFIIGDSCRVIPILRHYLDLRAVVAEFVSEAVFQHDRKHRDVIFQGKRQLCIFCPVLLMNEFGRDGKHYQLHFLEDIFHFLISGSCGSDLFVIEDRAVRVV